MRIAEHWGDVASCEVGFQQDHDGFPSFLVTEVHLGGSEDGPEIAPPSEEELALVGQMAALGMPTSFGEAPKAKAGKPKKARRKKKLTGRCADLSEDAAACSMDFLADHGTVAVAAAAQSSYERQVAIGELVFNGAGSAAGAHSEWEHSAAGDVAKAEAANRAPDGNEELRAASEAPAAAQLQGAEKMSLPGHRWGEPVGTAAATWQALWDPQYQQYYFVNDASGSSQWEAPPGFEHYLAGWQEQEQEQGQ
eukprot:jgi/Mesen1/6482/ME000331S05595